VAEKVRVIAKIFDKREKILFCMEKKENGKFDAKNYSIHGCFWTEITDTNGNCLQK
jgi:hypothetical protein